MNYVLAPWVPIDAGQRPDGTPQPGRAPRGVGAEPFTTIDLRNGTSNGFCLLALDGRVPAGTVQVSETGFLDRASGTTKRALQTALGITLTASTFRAALAEIMLEHSREDGTRWRGLRPTRQGRYEIWLGNEKLVDLPRIAGGSSFSSTFTQSDGEPTGFTEVVGDWDVLSNALTLSTANGNCTLRADTDLGGADHYAEIQIITVPSDGNATYGACTRFAAAVETCYLFRFSKGAPAHQIWRVVGGSYDFLGQAGATSAANDLLRGESNGTTQTFYRNGVSQVSLTNAVIDGVVVGGPRGGICGNNTGGATVGVFDNYSSDILGGLTTAQFMPGVVSAQYSGVFTGLVYR